jgi:hypothetical protein
MPTATPRHQPGGTPFATGPTLKARERLTAEGRWEKCRREIVAMAERRNEANDGSLLLRSEYLVAIGRKAS